MTIHSKEKLIKILEGVLLIYDKVALEVLILKYDYTDEEALEAYKAYHYITKGVVFKT